MSPNVFFALIIGSAMVLGVVVFNNLSQFLPQRASNDQPTFGNLREPVAVAMTDGTPDWQFTLTNERVAAAELQTTISSEFQPPETLVGQFGIDLFTLLIESGSQPDLDIAAHDAQMDALVTRYTEKTLPSVYTSEDIRIIPRGNESAIRNYLNEAATIFIANNPVSDYLIPELFSRVIEFADEDARQELLRLADQYQIIRDQYLNISVPAEIAEGHLALINAINLLQHDLVNIANFKADSLPGYVGILRYNDNSLGLTRAMQNLGIEVLRYQRLFDFDVDDALLFVAALPQVN